jgi:hypothetical protein
MLCCAAVCKFEDKGGEKGKPDSRWRTAIVMRGEEDRLDPRGRKVIVTRMREDGCRDARRGG